MMNVRRPRAGEVYSKKGKERKVTFVEDHGVLSYTVHFEDHRGNLHKLWGPSWDAWVRSARLLVAVDSTRR